MGMACTPYWRAMCSYKLALRFPVLEGFGQRAMIAMRSDERSLESERWKLLRKTSRALDKPLTALAFVWLILVVVDLTTGLSATGQVASNAIWLVFVLHFVLEFWIAPAKLKYLRRNWLTTIALVLPAFRALRAFRGLRALRYWRAASAARPLSLLRVITSLNRGMRALEATLGRAKVGYAVALTLIVNFGAAAGMYAFENPRALMEAGFSGSTGLTSYGEAVWWTAMMLTTMGTDYWPQTTEGRLLSWLLAVYAFAIFGYLTATVATLLLPGGLSSPGQEGKQSQELARLREEIALLRQALQERRDVSFPAARSLG